MPLEFVARFPRELESKRGPSSSAYLDSQWPLDGVSRLCLMLRGWASWVRGSELDPRRLRQPRKGGVHLIGVPHGRSRITCPVRAVDELRFSLLDSSSC